MVPARDILIISFVKPLGGTSHHDSWASEGSSVRPSIPPKVCVCQCAVGIIKYLDYGTGILKYWRDASSSPFGIVGPNLRTVHMADCTVQALASSFLGADQSHLWLIRPNLASSAYLCRPVSRCCWTSMRRGAGTKRACSGVESSESELALGRPIADSTWLRKDVGFGYFWPGTILFPSTSLLCHKCMGVILHSEMIHGQFISC